MKKIISIKLIILVLFTSFFLVSCEKEIEIDLNEGDTQIVIEGEITNEPGPYKVKISKTVNFNKGNNFPGVSNAIVTITDNLGNTEQLIEIENGIYQTSSLVGIQGNTYTLNISVEGKNYSAISKMPMQVNLDSLRFNEFSAPLGGGNSLTTVPMFKDPVEKGNNYRFFFSVNGEKNTGYIITNDNVNNGQENQRPIFDQELEVNMGDTVIVEMRCIDLNIYNYFYTLSQISGGGPGGGATPSNPPNNITGDKALGYFSAHTIQKRLQIATK